MRLCPYTLLPATGQTFYGRTIYLDSILRGPKTTHLLGIRGAGKTSILLKVVELAPALYLSFQEMVGQPHKFRSQVYLQLLEKRGRYPWLPRMTRNDDPFEAIGEAVILAGQAGQPLFLLFDEAEGLQCFEADFLQQISGLLNGIIPVRVVLASAKNISSLNERIITLGNSPLLLPRPLYLTGFEDEAATALICQAQLETPLAVPLPLVEAIKYHTNCQPHLIQWLCARLWSLGEDPATWHIGEDLLHLYDDQLADRFRADFNYLAPLERKMMWAVLHDQLLPDGVASGKLNLFLDHLTALGYLRRGPDNRYKIGNTFLLNWFNDCGNTLDWEKPTPQQPSDQAANTLYQQTTPRYNLQRLRKFLTLCFTDVDLRYKICFDLAAFRPIYEQLGPEMGKEQVIQHLLEFAERHLLLNELLAELRQLNPQQYQAYYSSAEIPDTMDFPAPDN